MQISSLAFVIASMYLISCGSSKQSATSLSQTNSEGYKLVWADEFNKDGKPDSLNWRYEKGFARNHEAQWYQGENAYCKDGLLIIEARKEHKANPVFEAGSKDWRKQREHIEYTSASINTSHLQSWQYGRFVMRGRIDISKGLWPAWWTLGTKGNWPANGEIDIMEYYRNMLLANIACLDTNGKAEWHSNRYKVDSLGGKQWASAFHIWRMDWDENNISLFVDDVLLNKVSLDKLVNKDNSGVNPFNQPHYMLLDLAMGGDNGGDITSETPFPNKFEVDYVRVYQKK